MTTQRGNNVLQAMLAAMADLFWPLWRTHHERHGVHLLSDYICPCRVVEMSQLLQSLRKICRTFFLVNKTGWKKDTT